MARLLLTGTEAVNQRLAEQLEASGHESVSLPLLKVKPVAYELPQIPPKALLLTSRNALPAAEGYQGTPCYVVGKQLAENSIAKGHKVAKVADRLQDLLPELPEEILYLRGKEVRFEPDVLSVICYEAELQNPPHLLPVADAIVLISARVATILPNYHLPVFCISQTVSAALSHYPDPNIRIAEQPTEQALLELINHWSPHPKSL
jgi:uroporphyrinogen-III synthase